MQVQNIQQNTSEWIEFRKSHIGASEASAIMGINPWETPYQCWARKMGLLESKPITQAMQKGMDLEQKARIEFEAWTGIKTKPVVLKHRDIHYMIASLDGISNNADIILEIKCPNETTHEMARNKKIPDYYMAQIQHQIEVSGIDDAYYATYRNGEMNIVEVERDEEIIDRILESQSDFYRRMTEFDAPDVKHKVESSSNALIAAHNYRSVYEKSKAVTIELNEAKKKLMGISNGECIICDGIKITHYHERGRVDYSAIKELENIDLDKYRKSPILKSRITLI